MQQLLFPHKNIGRIWNCLSYESAVIIVFITNKLHYCNYRSPDFQIQSILTKFKMDIRIIPIF